MDFGKPLVAEESVTSTSRICYVEQQQEETRNNGDDDQQIAAANQAALETLVGGAFAAPVSKSCPRLRPTKRQKALCNASLYPDYMKPRSADGTIQAGDLVVIFESFDSLTFCYVTPGKIFSNRNGNFPHSDFIGKPFGCKIRSKDNRGFGFLHLLQPTPELWARSLNHRTQIIHELDASMIVYSLELRPNMVVCESGTGSAALSHCLLRTLAPHGHLHTFEFNQHRAEQARQEFDRHGLSHLVTVHNKDVCGKQSAATAGFDQPCSSVDAVVLDLPEPWLAVPHAAWVCRRGTGRLASYSPCVEQAQKTVAALHQWGFHSITTREFRLREHYVDTIQLEDAPRTCRPPQNKNPFIQTGVSGVLIAKVDPQVVQEKKDNKARRQQKSETVQTMPVDDKKKNFVVARPYVSMRGHTAFLTFASRGPKAVPDPLANLTETQKD